MPLIKTDELKTLNVATTTIFNIDPDATQIALHEAAHTLAAIAHNVPISRIWVKAAKASGSSRLTAGSDGKIWVHPNDPHQDCFISLVGLAWEERYGNPALGLSDAQAHNFRRAWVLEDARQFVIAEYFNIYSTAAAIIGLRDQQGWVKGKRLIAMREWISPRVNKLESLYLQGCIGQNEPW